MILRLVNFVFRPDLDAGPPAPYIPLVNLHEDALLPPDGLRPGQLGVVLLGRVIIGDIAATLVDLASREIVQVAEDQDAGGWLLGVPPGAAPGSRDQLLGYEKALVRGLPAGRLAGIDELCGTYRAAMDRARARLIADAVRRGWIKRLRRYERTERGEELARRVRSFQRDLRRLRAEQGESALEGGLLPYALHFGLVRSGELPLARFAGAWVTACALLPGWRRAEPRRRRSGDVPPSGPSVDEQMMRYRDELWVMSITGGW